jgi:hypothetical protein
MYVTSNFHVLKYQIRKHDPGVYIKACRVIKIIILENEHFYGIKRRCCDAVGGRDYRFTIRH